jgi:hypothetical protein
VEKKSFHPKIKQFFENYFGAQEQPRNACQSEHDRRVRRLEYLGNLGNLVETQYDRRARRLEALARELRRNGYIVMVNKTKSGMVVIVRD